MTTGFNLMNIMMHPKPHEPINGSEAHFAQRNPESRSIAVPDKPSSLRERTVLKSALSMPWYRLVRELAQLGLVVAVPTGLGLASGLWIDTMLPSSLSWMMIMTPVGFLLGAGFAVFWWAFS